MPAIPRSKPWLWLLVLALLLLGLLLQRSGLEALGYYAHLVDGHRQVMLGRTPVNDLLADEELDEALRERLALSKELREFSVTVLDLPDNASYRSYTDLGREAVLWNVTAVPEFSLQAKRWCYPVVGCQSYRGYFNRDAAHDKGAALAEEGYDVRINPVTAYSTLGRFPDPLLNTMLARDELRLAEVLFHELAHQRLYIRGDTAFNEAYATFVGQQGVRLWLKAVGESERIREFERRHARAARFRGLLADTRTRLARLYDSGLPESVMRNEKAVILAGLHRRFLASVAEDPDMADWAGWFHQPVNNARLAAVATYHEWVPAFARLYEQAGEDMADFHAAAERLSAKDSESRQQRLTELRDAVD